MRLHQITAHESSHKNRECLRLVKLQGKLFRRKSFEIKNPVHSPECRSFGSVVVVWGWLCSVYWMWAAFIVAFVLAAGVLIIFGVGERGTAIALRATARWSFLLFWLAYVGGSIAWLCGPRFDGLARRGREFGLAYASAQLIHVGLVLWIIHIATGPSGAMVFFWIGIFCTYLLALFSWPRLRDALGPRLWRIFRTIALEYIAIALHGQFYRRPAARGRTLAAPAALPAVCADAYCRSGSARRQIFS